MKYLTLFRQLVAAMGFCCPYAFIRAMRGTAARVIAAKLGVHFRTISYWRKKLRTGECRCGNETHCAEKLYYDVPRLSVDDLSVRGEGRGDPFVR